MKTLFYLISIFSMMWTSCTKTVLVTRYHHFTNEYKVPGKVQLPEVEVYHQIYNNILHITLVNTGEDKIYFYPQGSSLKFGSFEQAFDTNSTNNLILTGGTKKVFFDVNELLHAANVNPSQDQQIDIIVNIGLTDDTRSEYFVNSYKLQQLGSRVQPSKKAGTNAIAVTQARKRLDVAETVKGFFTITGILILAILTAEVEEE